MRKGSCISMFAIAPPCGLRNTAQRAMTTARASSSPGVDRPVAVLLADRDDDTREMYAEFLRRSGWEVDEAHDGREALAKVIINHPDVVVTAIRLPGISGV